MRCDSLNDYFLGELPMPQADEMRRHVAACVGCREELERLRLTNAALLSVADEEPPRRIAFVSDKVVSPPWWQRLWDSGPRLGFASAGLLSAALLVHAFARPPRQVIVREAAAPVQAVSAADVDRAVERAFASHVEPTIRKVLAESEARQEARMAQVADARVAALEKRVNFDQKAMAVALEENLTLLKKEMRRYVVASNDLGGGR